jgi:thiamine kinase-like enzyme
LVTGFVSGRGTTPSDVRRPEVLERVVEVLRRYHDGPAGAGWFSPFATVRAYHALARERDVAFPNEMDAALLVLRRIEEAVSADNPACPCHNDLLPANFIDDGESIRIIDWEYAGMGDRFFDLGNLAVNNDFADDDERRLLELYFGQVRDDDLRRLRLMRLASDLRESLWGFLQSAVSTLEFDFLAYGQAQLQRFVEGSKGRSYRVRSLALRPSHGFR